VLLVTGASRGIGAATARLAARQGYDLVVSYREQAGAAAEVVAACEQAGAAALAVAADVAVEADVLALFAACDARFGRLDVLVNNAGMTGRLARLDTYDAARIEHVLAVNVLGAFLCAREAVKRMSTRHGGSGGTIVNVSSVAARLGSPGEYIDYAAAKAAVDTLTIGLAKEVATEAVRVVAVRPGLVYTDIHAASGEPGRVDRLAPVVPMQRGGQPEEIAETILWLASPAASYVTGAILDVSGGR
jgi:NAD(P)-dependent dehydrogenase (short-subunit alcohol dehydrogenase family)